MRAPTGIEALDRGLGGGFRCPSSVLFFSEVIAEKRIFAEQFIVAGLHEGQTCLYLDFYRAPQFARREFMKFGEFNQDSLILIDTVSAQILQPSTEQYQVRDIGDITEILQSVEAVIKEKRPARVVLDSLDFLTERFSKEEVLDFLKGLIDVAKDAGSVVGLLFVNWSYDKEDLEEVLAVIDYRVEFKTTLRGGVLMNHLRFKRNGGKDGTVSNWVPFNFRELMGLVVYFPKILVTGPYQAGKSTAVQGLSETAVSVDRLGTTVAFDYGSLDISGVELGLLGTPGQGRFEFIFKVFAREVNGIILVVDSTQPEDLERAKAMRRLAGVQFPLVVLANKRDLPGAMPIEEIRKGLELEEEVPVVESIATEGVGLREGLEKLIEIIIWGWPVVQ